ncbi:hypothetical protein HDU78_007477 [Chytriomyces hyalinus]|nr:hypothetical protein HDU78_007477 [Chytriomyces hyalinus]
MTQPDHAFLATAHTLLSSNKYGKGVTRPVTAWLNAVQLPESSPSTTAKLEHALLQALHSASSYDPQLRHVYSQAVLLFKSPDSAAPLEVLQEDANDLHFSSISSNQESTIDTNDTDDQQVDPLVSLTTDQLHHVSLSVIDSGLFGKGVTAPLKAWIAAVTVAAPNAEKLQAHARYVLYAASSYSKDLRRFISSAAANVAAVAHAAETKRFTKTVATTIKTVTSHNESGQRVITTVTTTKTTFSPL